MFAWLNKQGVQSNKGFTVQFTGRFSLEYRKNNFCMECDVESLGGNQLCVRVPKLPLGNLSQEGRSQIVQEIREALEFQELDADIE